LVTGVPLSQLVPGKVVWVHVPFDDVDQSKTRPAIVVAERGREVELLPVTSSASRHCHPHEYVEVERPEAIGLDSKCAIGRRPVVVERNELLQIVGELDEVVADLVLADLCGTAA